MLKIINSYAYGGDFRSADEFAPIKAWIKLLIMPLLLALLLASLVCWTELRSALHYHSLSFVKSSDFVKKPGALIVSVIPCLLGFGIGVYALIFALAAPFIRQFNNLILQEIESGKIKYGSSLALNADLGYPLIVLILGIFVAVFQQSCEGSQWLVYVTWAVFWYCLIVMVEIVGVIYGLAEHSILDKTTDDVKKQNDNGSMN